MEISFSDSVKRLQQMFAHAMTAMLAFLMQNFVVITSLEFGWDQTGFSIKFEF